MVKRLNYNPTSRPETASEKDLSRSTNSRESNQHGYFITHRRNQSTKTRSRWWRRWRGLARDLRGRLWPAEAPRDSRGGLSGREIKGGGKGRSTCQRLRGVAARAALFSPISKHTRAKSVHGNSPGKRKQNPSQCSCRGRSRASFPE
jgi:hypothetical protein